MGFFDKLVKAIESLDNPPAQQQQRQPQRVVVVHRDDERPRTGRKIPKPESDRNFEVEKGYVFADFYLCVGDPIKKLKDNTIAEVYAVPPTSENIAIAKEWGWTAYDNKPIFCYDGIPIGNAGLGLAGCKLKDLCDAGISVTASIIRQPGMHGDRTPNCAMLTPGERELLDDIDRYLEEYGGFHAGFVLNSDVVIEDGIYENRFMLKEIPAKTSKGKPKVGIYFDGELIGSKMSTADAYDRLMRHLEAPIERARVNKQEVEVTSNKGTKFRYYIMFDNKPSL